MNNRAITEAKAMEGILNIIKNHQGESNAISANEIIAEYLNTFNRKISGSQIRRYVKYARQDGEPVCSNGIGYFVASSADELEACIERLRRRMSHQYQTNLAMIRQLNVMKDRLQLKLEI